MLYRLIAPNWLVEETNARRVLEGEFSSEQIKKYNKQGYNIYYLPNYPSIYSGGTVDGSQIDTFKYVFIDFDLKSGTYESKDEFLEVIAAQEQLKPTKIIDTGNGIHVYWKVSDLDARSYLRLTRRLMRLFGTDEAVGQIYQLMRVPGTINTKRKDNLVNSELLYEDESTEYTGEELDAILPLLTPEDDAYCNQHYDKTYHPEKNAISINEKIPPKFGKLLRKHPEAMEIWSGNSTDRSKDDFRLGHIMFANGFSKEEAASVLVNSAKALSRAPIHRVNYATNIIDKIWTFEIEGEEAVELSSSVAQILRAKGSDIKGIRLTCNPRIDNTAKGFRLGQVLGLVAGSGVGKTTFALNMFRWFAQHNPNYHHFFIPLEQPAHEIADRWQTMCGSDTTMHDKVHVLSNYDEQGNFRHLSLDEIKEYILNWKQVTGNEIGCVVIDHVGALKKKGSNDENQDLITICHSMKAFAVQTNTFLVMQSQTSREKAGIGDLELDKDAAYGTATFEWYCDYLVTMWQPLKRFHSNPDCRKVTAYKFCKIRHKNAQDVILEDEPYYLKFNAENETLVDMTQDDDKSFDYFQPQAAKKRAADRKTGVVTYKSVMTKEKEREKQTSGNT